MVRMEKWMAIQTLIDFHVCLRVFECDGLEYHVESIMQNASQPLIIPFETTCGPNITSCLLEACSLAWSRFHPHSGGTFELT